MDSWRGIDYGQEKRTGLTDAEILYLFIDEYKERNLEKGGAHFSAVNI